MFKEKNVKPVDNGTFTRINSRCEIVAHLAAKYVQYKIENQKNIIEIIFLSGL